MEEKTFKFPHLPLNFYDEILISFKNNYKQKNKLSFRHLDVIATLILVKTNKERAELLDIKLGTFDTTIKNIADILDIPRGISSISKFIRKQDLSEAFIRHYRLLDIKYNFEKKLREIKRTINKNLPFILIKTVKDFQNESLTSLSDFVSVYLEFLGITVIKENDKLQNFSQELENYQHAIFFIDSTFIMNLKSKDNADEFLRNFYGLEKILKNYNLLLHDAKLKDELLKNSFTNYLDLTNSSSYFVSFIELLKIIIPGSDFKSLEEMLVSYNFIEDISVNNKSLFNKLEFLSLRKKLIEKIIKAFFLSIFLLCLTFLSYFIVNNFTNKKFFQNPIHDELIIPSQSLLERQAIMEDIELKLKKSRGVILLGAAGAGKTIIARTYANRQEQASVITEINAQTPQTLSDSFKKLAYKLADKGELDNVNAIIREIDDPIAREDKLIHFVRDKLRNKPGWLLIYDNYDNSANFNEVKKYFPFDETIWGLGKYILTTKNENIKNINPLFSIICIKDLTKEEKFKLFDKVISSVSKKQLISKEKEEFLEEIPSFPLDVFIAASYLKSTNNSYRSYMNRLRESNEDFIKLQEEVLRTHTDYKYTRYSIITISLNEIISYNTHFQDLILLISLINSQDIPKKLLNGFKGETTVDDFILSLKRYGLTLEGSLNSHKLKSTFSIHRSTQSIALKFLTKKLNLEKNHNETDKIVKVIKSYMNDISDKENHQKLLNAIENGEALLLHKNLLSNESISTILSRLGHMLYLTSRFDKAKQYLKEALELQKNFINKDEMEIAYTEMNLGNIERELTNYSEAKNLLDNSLKKYNKVYSKNYNDMCNLLTYLGTTYRNLEYFEKAEEYLKKCTEKYYKYLSNNSNALSRAKICLGIVKEEMGNYIEAIELIEPNLSSTNKTPGRKAWIYVHLGNIYMEQGDIVKAIDYLEKASDIYEKIIANNHIGIGWAHMCLGNIYRDIGDYEKAKNHLEKGIKNYTTYYPQNHIHNAWALGHQALIALDNNQNNEAKLKFEESLRLYEKYLKKDHLKTVWIYPELSEAYLREKNYAEAYKLLDKARKLYEKQYGIKHLKTASVYLKMARLYFLQKNLNDSEHMIEKASQIYEKGKHYKLYACFELKGEIDRLKYYEAKTKNNIKEAQEWLGKSKENYEKSINTLNQYLPCNNFLIKKINEKAANLDV